MIGSERKEKRGFTLIELLIVVAIIAILAAIAVPNFLEAQVRSKVSRSKADLRTEAVAMEAYFVDWNSYPRDEDANFDMQFNSDLVIAGTGDNGLIQLTTPVAYINSNFADPFATGQAAVVANIVPGYYIGSGSQSYVSTVAENKDGQKSFELSSAVGGKAAFVALGIGPDQKRARNSYKNFPYMQVSGAEYGSNSGPTTMLDTGSYNQPAEYITYDPSNGTSSVGDIYQFGGSWHEGRFLLDGQVVGAETGPDPSTCW